MSRIVLGRAFVLLVVVAASLGTASARIGWTLEECLRKYGQFISQDQTENSYLFRVGEILIKVIVFRGTVGEIVYQNMDKSEFTDDELGSLLVKNSDLRTFLPLENSDASLRRSWRTTDGTRAAGYVIRPAPALDIFLTDFFESQKKASAANLDRL